MDAGVTGGATVPLALAVVPTTVSVVGGPASETLARASASGTLAPLAEWRRCGGLAHGFPGKRANHQATTLLPPNIQHAAASAMYGP